MKCQVVIWLLFYCKPISFGFFSCNRIHCNLCAKTLPSTFAFDNNFQQFRILYYINCTSSNVVFSIYFTLCGPISVKFSLKLLYYTFNSVLHTISNKFLHPLSVHFHKPNHSLDNLRIQGLDLVFSTLIIFIVNSLNGLGNQKLLINNLLLIYIFKNLSHLDLFYVTLKIIFYFTNVFKFLFFNVLVLKSLLRLVLILI